MIFRALNPGDVVRLRSGGHWMTVEKTDGNTTHVVYFPVKEDYPESPTEYEPDPRRAAFLEITLIHEDDCVYDVDEDDDEQS